jgi:ketosteroid isomerase-like protein
MSQENIDRLHQAYEAFSRRDFDEALTFAHPDIEFFPPGNAAPYRGIEKFRTWIEPDAFDRQVIEPLEFIDLGDKVLVKQHVKSRGAGSGIELEGRSWSVWTVNEDGLGAAGSRAPNISCSSPARPAGTRRLGPNTPVEDG